MPSYEIKTAEGTREKETRSNITKYNSSVANQNPLASRTDVLNQLPNGIDSRHLSLVMLLILV